MTGVRAKFRKVVVVLITVGLLIFTWVIIQVRHPPPPAAMIKVVDEAGNPVAGAVILPDGFRTKKGSTHYFWSEDTKLSVKPAPVTTDADGLAKVYYPRYGVEKLETSEISFAVDHPDFCHERLFRVVDPSPPQNASFRDKAKFWMDVAMRRTVSRPAPVVLTHGAMVKVFGLLDQKPVPAKYLYAQMSEVSWAVGDLWRQEVDALVCHRIPNGTNQLRLVYLPENGAAYFSEPFDFLAQSGKAGEFRVDLKRGLRVKGQLDSSVPRPVADGVVLVEATPAIKSGAANHVQWSRWCPVASDGTFEIDSLPAGQLEVIGICDGFMSRDGVSRVGSSIRVPQTFSLAQDGQELELKMNPTTDCRITVLDDAGRPLAGAMVGFWPNVMWEGKFTTIFAMYLKDSQEFLRRPPERKKDYFFKNATNRFAGVSDHDGIAVVRNLPGTILPFSVSHTNYDMPIRHSGGSEGRRDATIALTIGQTAATTIQMEKKGKETLQHPR